MIGNEGSFQRYLFTAAVNTVIFLILWEIFFLVLPNSGIWPTISWGGSWILSSYIAHWTHRILTFNSERDIKWTIPASMSVYAFTLVGSMTTYYVATEILSLSLSNQIEFAGLIFEVGVVWITNYAIWGGLNYIGQKYVAFSEVKIDHLSESE